MIAEILIGSDAMSTQLQGHPQIAVNALRSSVYNDGFFASALFIAGVFYFYSYYYFWQKLSGMLFAPAG